MTSASLDAAVGVERIDADTVDLVLDQLVAVYAGAFAAPPYHETSGHAQRFADALRAAANAEDFRCRVARDVLARRAVGFAYGMTFQGDGTPWRAVGPRVEAARLRGRFEVVELAVHPGWQRRGIGGLLLDGLLEGIAHPDAWLLANPAATDALEFYRGRGWTELGAWTLGPRRRVVLRRPAAP